MRELNLEGLNDDELSLVDRYVAILRERREEQRRAAERFLAALEKRKPLSPPLSEEEAERIAQEAVAYARGRL